MSTLQGSGDEVIILAISLPALASLQAPPPIPGCEGLGCDFLYVARSWALTYYRCAGPLTISSLLLPARLALCPSIGRIKCSVTTVVPCSATLLARCAGEALLWGPQM